MNIESRIREIRAQISEAEQCRGECAANSREADALGHLIRALEAMLSLLRELARLFPGDR